MEIVISLDRVDPPVGRLRRCDADRRCGTGRLGGARADGVGVGFTGWLGLLRALDELIARGDRATPDE